MPSDAELSATDSSAASLRLSLPGNLISAEDCSSSGANPRAAGPGSQSRLTGDPDVGTVHHPDQKISPATTRPGQAFVWNTQHLSAPHPGRDLHSHETSPEPAKALGSTLRRQLRRDPQVTSQIGSTGLEPEIRAGPDPHDDKPTAKSTFARHPETRSRCRTRRHRAFVQLRSSRIGRVIHTHLQGGSNQEIVEPQGRVLGNVPFDPPRTHGHGSPLGSRQFAVVGLPLLGIDQDGVGGVENLSPHHGGFGPSVDIRMMLLGEHTIGGPDVRLGTAPVKTEGRVVIW